MISEPCLVPDMPASVYHADPCESPSLSSGIARTIIAKSLASAKAEHPRLGGTKKPSTEAMDRGALVHALLAGTSEAEFAVNDFPTFRSKVAQEWAYGVRALGKTPVLLDDLEQARLIAEAVREKAALGTTISPFDGTLAEATAVWKRNGFLYRARYDRITTREDEPRTAWDFKVTSDISPNAVKRSFRRYRYDLQEAHYLAGLDALFPEFAGRHSLVFVFVEDEFPFSVRRYCTKPDTRMCARLDIERAWNRWERALATNEWPDGSTGETTFIEIPNYEDEEDEIKV